MSWSTIASRSGEGPFRASGPENVDTVDVFESILCISFLPEFVAAFDEFDTPLIIGRLFDFVTDGDEIALAGCG